MVYVVEKAKSKKIIAKNIITGETKIYDAMIEAKKMDFYHQRFLDVAIMEEHIMDTYLS